jgi:spore photoproduct lyase
MFSAIYFEKAIKDHPRVLELLARFSQLPHIECERYGEVFNRSAQNFRIQKQNPALILARKHGNCVLPAPAGYGFEGGESYYFSHMMNCLYDCRYCFLQGMYRSAHYVLFINYEDFAAEIQTRIKESPEGTIFYSGYDCDSLAMEPVSHFCQFFMPLFAQNPHAVLEIRTKSTQVRDLLEMQPIANCVIAMSFTAKQASKRFEHKVPSIEKRLDALGKLQRAGWKVALRFEPIVYNSKVLSDYAELFEHVFSVLERSQIHSASIGEFRMPSDFYKTIVKLYPDEALFASPIEVIDGMASLQEGAGQDTLAALEAQLLNYVSPAQYYRCA